MVPAWRCKGNVIMLHNYYNNYIEVIERREKNNRTMTIPKPVVIICVYNRYMGSIVKYHLQIYSKISGMVEKMFFWFLEVL